MKYGGAALAGVCVPFDDKAAHAHGSQQQRGEGADWTATHDDDIDDGPHGLSERHCHVTVRVECSSRAMPRINVNQQLVSIDGVQMPSHTAASLSAFTAAAQHAQGRLQYKCEKERRRGMAG